ncbi:uncharacterized protein LOC119440434 isoform X2 [Dermacentor silvarum]|uniref:uncharacterized protein LOC119440434 isoform X2 n=1 Tax=Dermacentor silvarum TaxID=543639 RepID=UPI002100D8CF|nr:uncharacterized protein LOC119440434 isoform X2 [Dermacentor silvarum]
MDVFFHLASLLIQLQKHQKNKVVASLATIEVSDDALYLGLMSMSRPDSWPYVYQLCKDTVEKHANKNVFARVTDEMERACKITDVLPVRSPWMLVKTVAKVIEPCRLVYRIPGVTMQPTTPQNLTEVALYDEHVMKSQRDDYLSALTSDKGSFGRVAYEKGAVCGFLVAHRLPDGSAIATHLVADDKHVAKMLLLEAQNSFPPAAQKGIVLVVPLMDESDKPGSYSFAEDLRLVGDRVSCLLFSRCALPLAYQKIYSLGDFV